LPFPYDIETYDQPVGRIRADRFVAGHPSFQRIAPQNRRRQRENAGADFTMFGRRWFGESEMPPHVEYSLSLLGEEVSGKVAALADWIEFRLPDILQARADKHQ
jgi:hypothetical protein